MTTTESRQQASREYITEHLDRLPFGSPRKAARYQTERFKGATGRNWYASDPSLQFLMRFYLSPRELGWAEPHLHRLGALMGGLISELAEETDKNPPRLVKYDKWGHDISKVVLPDSVIKAKQAIFENNFSAPAVRDEAQREGIRLEAPIRAYSYMLHQADIGLACAIGTGGGMVTSLVNQFASDEVRDWVMPKFLSGEWRGAAAQLLTERTGGSDLAQMETTATPDGDAYRLNGLKWFASNADGEAYVVMAKPEGAPDTMKGVCTFLVLKQRRDGSRNGVLIRQLKDKLGTRSVASAEVEFVDAEAFLLSGEPDTSGEAGGDGKGAARMMSMTNGARLGVASFGLGCARRAFLESVCFATAREAFGAPLVDQPLMRRKLAEMIVDLEAAQAMVFDGYGLTNHLRSDSHPLRIGAPIIKLKAARLGITMASDAIEVHGGNGYTETWPVARILRDAQVNTVWEGTDNILCLDVRRAIEREGAEAPFIDRLREAVDNTGESVKARRIVAERIEDLDSTIKAWKRLDRPLAEARLFPLAQFMGDVYAGALLIEQAEWEQREFGRDRKALVARLFAERYLTERGPRRGIDAPQDEALSRFDELLAGAFRDEDATA